MINVTKTFLPPIEEYNDYLKGIWKRGWITNNGELVQELERKLKEYLQVKHLFYCANGTIVLQMALKALEISKKIITTPFSYVATSNAILWENCTPVFVDINSLDFCIDPEKIEEAITSDTQAILATHVYGNPCDVNRIQEIAIKHDLKVIYDGAHGFGTTMHGKSILAHGDFSTCSFHATKIFHTTEGGAIITEDDKLAHKIHLYRQFGHINEDYFSFGINAKNSEFHAAMGLCNLPKFNLIKEKRKIICELYDKLLFNTKIIKPKAIDEVDYNFAYYPVFFETEEILLNVKVKLERKNIFGRRYFFPSLNRVPFYKGESCPISENYSKRAFCLPLYFDLDLNEVENICKIINEII